MAQYHNNKEKNNEIEVKSSFWAATLRESISHGYPFFFVRKGHKYFFYSVLLIHLSPYN